KIWFHRGVWLKSGASKRQPASLTKCSLTVAVTQQSWREGNHYFGLFGVAAQSAPDILAFGGPSAAHRPQLGNRQRIFSSARIDSHGYRATNDQSEFSKA